MSSHFRKRFQALAGCALVLVLGFATTALSPQRVLRVCADPNNLPFSNARGEGFENQLAQLAGKALGARVRYTWWPQRRGFIRNTLDAGRCDLVMGLPSGSSLVSSTRPYYTSTYVFVVRKDRRLHIRSFDDPALRQLRIGVHLVPGDGAATPAMHALSRRELADNLVGYPITGDYAKPNPPARILEAVARGDIDVAVIWGPLAGYFAARQLVPLEVTAVDPRSAEPGFPLSFSIAMGVRQGDERLRRELDHVLDRHRQEIDHLLDRYHIPRVERRYHGDAEYPEGR